jgi:hypothetical protein
MFDNRRFKMRRLQIVGTFLVFFLSACGPKAPIKPSGDFVAINPQPQAVGSYEKRPPSDHFEYTFQGDLRDAIAVLQKLQPQLVVRPIRGTPYPVRVEIDARNVTLNEVLAQLRDLVGKEVAFDFNATQKKRRPYVQVSYLKKK